MPEDTNVNVDAETPIGTEAPRPVGEATEKPEGGAPVENTTAQNSSGAVPDDTVAYITALQADLEEARVRAEDAEKRLLYAQAEFQTVLRRRDEQYKADQKYANSEIIKTLLPALDNFDRALKAAEQTRNFDSLVGGVTGTQKQLLTLLEKAGVTPIETLGKEFDPVYHEAIGHAEESDLPANMVAEEVQRGYVMHDRVLRPALVKVAGG